MTSICSNFWVSESYPAFEFSPLGKLSPLINQSEKSTKRPHPQTRPRQSTEALIDLRVNGWRTVMVNWSPDGQAWGHNSSQLADCDAVNRRYWSLNGMVGDYSCSAWCHNSGVNSSHWLPVGQARGHNNSQLADCDAVSPVIVAEIDLSLLSSMH